ncbi:MAG: universal stress protein [Terriglobales bacterium]
MSAIASTVDPRLKSVLVATDFSEASQKPLRHALAIARHYGAKLYFAHVVSSLGFNLAGADALNAATEAAKRDANQLETRLVESGALAGLHHEFIIGQGAVWEVLNRIIRQEQVDLIVSGARGSRGLRKLLLGSVAEQIFRYADCMVFTVGPGSYQETRADQIVPNRTFLFATDFSEASLHALPYAVSYANQFGAKLVLLHVIPTAPNPKGLVHTAALQALEDVSRKGTLKVKPECVVEFCPAGPISEKILEKAEKLKVDLIIMGLRRSKHVEASSHAPWATAYEVVCGAGCPVVTTRQ